MIKKKGVFWCVFFGCCCFCLSLTGSVQAGLCDGPWTTEEPSMVLGASEESLLHLRGVITCQAAEEGLVLFCTEH